MSWEASESDSQQANTVNAADAFPSEHSESSDAAMPLSDQVGVVNSAKPAMSKFVVRMPADLLEKLKHVSRYHNRSMNTEINLLLGRYIEQVKGESRPGVDEHLKLDSQLLHKLGALSEQKIEALLDLLD